MTAKEKRAEKKEAKAIYDKAYRLKNKEKLKAKRDANKEKTKAYTKAWRLANKERLKAYDKATNKAWYEANKEKAAALNKANRESKKLPYNIVYCIPDYDGLGNNYAGVTNQPEIRMNRHKNLGKLNTSDWYELGRCDCREEAEVLESSFHKLGYHGAHRFKDINKAA